MKADDMMLKLVLCTLVLSVQSLTCFCSIPALSNTAEALLGGGMEYFCGVLVSECYLLLCHG